MGAAAQLLDDSMTNYKPAPEKKVPLNMRVPGSLKKKLETLVRLWKAQAIARKDDPTNIDVTHVCTELLSDGVAAAFEAYGGMPVDEAATDKLIKAIADGVASVKKK